MPVSNIKVIDFINATDWYDGPLSGWARVESKYYYFHLTENNANRDVHTLYTVPNRLEKKMHLLSFRKFRHYCGWYHCFSRHKTNGHTEYKDTKHLWLDNPEYHFGDLNLQEMIEWGWTDNLEEVHVFD